MDYFVIAPNGQKFGPAPVPVLNQWIQEGRIAPDTLLQDAATGAQIVARALPGLDFMPRPVIAPPGANPYNMASPAQNPAYYVRPSQWQQPATVSEGQAIGALCCTVAAPVFVLFCYLGLAFALFGFITGVQLVKQGAKLSGGLLIGFNALWMLAYVIFRVWVALS